MEVPLIVFVAVLLVYHDDVMLTPGAKMSTQEPKFAHDAFVSLLLVALTVIAEATRAGDDLQASCATPMKLPLPAAIAYVTPLAMELATALSNAVEAPPPSDMLATAGPT